MEALFIIGTILLIIAVTTIIGTVIYTKQGLSSAKSEDFLQKYYEEEFGDDLK